MNGCFLFFQVFHNRADHHGGADPARALAVAVDAERAVASFNRDLGRVMPRAREKLKSVLQALDIRHEHGALLTGRDDLTVIREAHVIGGRFIDFQLGRVPVGLLGPHLSVFARESDGLVFPELRLGHPVERLFAQLIRKVHDSQRSAVGRR